MIVVTNLGKVWYISKNELYDECYAYQLLKETYKSVSDVYSDIRRFDKVIEKFLKIMHNKGIRRN